MNQTTGTTPGAPTTYKPHTSHGLVLHLEPLQHTNHTHHMDWYYTWSPYNRQTTHITWIGTTLGAPTTDKPHTSHGLVLHLEPLQQTNHTHHMDWYYTWSPYNRPTTHITWTGTTLGAPTTDKPHTSHGLVLHLEPLQQTNHTHHMDWYYTWSPYNRPTTHITWTGTTLGAPTTDQPHTSHGLVLHLEPLQQTNHTHHMDWYYTWSPYNRQTTHITWTGTTRGSPTTDQPHTSHGLVLHVEPLQQTNHTHHMDWYYTWSPYNRPTTHITWTGTTLGAPTTDQPHTSHGLVLHLEPLQQTSHTHHMDWYYTWSPYNRQTTHITWTGTTLGAPTTDKPHTSHGLVLHLEPLQQTNHTHHMDWYYTWSPYNRQTTRITWTGTTLGAPTTDKPHTSHGLVLHLEPLQQTNHTHHMDWYYTWSPYNRPTTHMVTVFLVQYHSNSMI